MFSYVQIALALLKLVQFFVMRAHDNKLISEGEDRQIARETVAILEKSKFAKDTMQAISALDDKQTEDLLKQLGQA